MLRRIRNLCILSIALTSFHAAPLLAEPISQAKDLNKQQMSEELKKGKFTARVFCEKDILKPARILLSYDLMLDSTNRRLDLSSLDFSAERTDLGVALITEIMTMNVQDPFQSMILKDISYVITSDSSCGNTPEVNGITDRTTMAKAIQALNDSKADILKNNRPVRFRSISYPEYGYGEFNCPEELICDKSNGRSIMPEKCVEPEELRERKNNQSNRGFPIPRTINRSRTFVNEETRNPATPEPKKQIADEEPSDSAGSELTEREIVTSSSFPTRMRGGSKHELKKEGALPKKASASNPKKIHEDGENIFIRTVVVGLACLAAIAGLGILYHMIKKRGKKSIEKNKESEPCFSRVKTEPDTKKVSEMKKTERQETVDSKGENMEDEKEFEKRVDAYKAAIREFTAKMRKVKTREECYHIASQKNDLLKPLLGTNQKLLDALREETKEFSYVFQYKTEEFGDPRKRS